MALCKNVGSADRGVRAVVGIVALVLAFTTFHVMDGGVRGLIAIGVGVIMLLTATVGLCPLYVPLRFSTCKAPTR